MDTKVEMKNLNEDEMQQPFISPSQQQGTINTPQNNDSRRKRPTWDEKNNPMEFLLTSLGYLLGLSVINRIPYLTYRNGGCVFLIQYLVALLVLGFPMVALQMYIGQFTSTGILTCWEMFPLFTGVGYAMLAITVIMASHYAVINAWLVYYAFASFSNPLPWTTCDNEWNTEKCQTPAGMDDTFNSTDVFNSEFRGRELVSPSVEYWQNVFLQLGDELSLPLWYMVLPLLGIWMFVALILAFGTKVYGKAAYVITLLPYLIATILFIRFITLPGSMNGLKYLLLPKVDNFYELYSWIDAVMSAFYSMGMFSGPIITLSSYNKFRNDIVRDAFLLPLAHFITSVGYSMLVFALYGFLALSLNVSINDVVGGGVDVLFTMIADSFPYMVGSQGWSFLFYLMLSLLCIGVLLALAETVVTATLDLIPRLRGIRYIVVVCVCAILFALGLPYTLRIGYPLLQGVDLSFYHYTPLVGLLTVVCVAFMYGIFSFTFTNHALARFKDDLNLMLGGRGCQCLPWVVCGPFWIVMWCAILPLLLLLCWVYNNMTMVTTDRILQIGDFVLRYEFQYLFQFIRILPVLIIVITPLVLILIRCCRKGDCSRSLEHQIRPSRYWGPAQPEDRQGMSAYLPSHQFEVDPWL